jgi:hypothetical protein
VDLKSEDQRLPALTQSQGERPLRLRAQLMDLSVLSGLIAE